MFTKEDYQKLIHNTPITNMIMNTTNLCNCACKYCFTHPNPQHMTLDTAKKIVTWLMEEQPCIKNGGHFKDTPFINFFGGEPLLEYESVIKPLVEWAQTKEYNISWGVSTNCTLLTPTRLEFLRHHRFGILCSLDGIPSVQDEQRPLLGGGSSWQMVEPNLDLLGHYPQATFRSTITPYNCDKWFEGYAFARAHGFKSYFGGLDVSDTSWTDKHLEILAEQILKIAASIYQDLSDYGTCLYFSPLVKAIADYVHSFNPEPYFTFNRCGMGLGGLGVGVHGEFLGCQEHSTYLDKDSIFYIGNVDDGLDYERHFNLLYTYELQAREFEKNSECNNCEIKDNCYMASCPSNSYRMNGSFAKIIPIQCEFRKICFYAAMFFVNEANATNNTNVQHWIEERVLKLSQEEINELRL